MREAIRLNAQIGGRGFGLVVGLLVAIAASASTAESQIPETIPVETTAPGTVRETFKLPFDLRTPYKLDRKVGKLQIAGVVISREERRLVDAVLPPRGGQERFSWLRTVVQVQNTDHADAHDVRFALRLLDGAGAVIDEFEFGGKAWLAKTRDFALTRLAMNYVLPLVKSVELTVTVDP
jgi:hypothetical protein